MHRRRQKTVAAQVACRKPVIMRNICITGQLDFGGSPLWAPPTSVGSCSKYVACFGNSSRHYCTMPSWDDREDIIYIVRIEDGKHMRLALLSACVVMKWVLINGKANLLVVSRSKRKTSKILLMDPSICSIGSVDTSLSPSSHCSLGIYSDGAGGSLLAVLGDTRVERICTTTGRQISVITLPNGQQIQHPFCTEGRLPNMRPTPISHPGPIFSADKSMFALLIAHDRPVGSQPLSTVPNNATRQHHIEVRSSKDLTVVGLPTGSTLGSACMAWSPTCHLLVIAEWVPSQAPVRVTSWRPHGDAPQLTAINLQPPVVAMVGDSDSCTISWSRQGSLLLFSRGRVLCVYDTSTWQEVLSTADNRFALYWSSELLTHWLPQAKASEALLSPCKKRIIHFRLMSELRFMGCAFAANSQMCSGSTLCDYTAHHDRWAEVPLTRWAMRMTSSTNIASLSSVQVTAPQSSMNDLCQRNETKSGQSHTGLLVQASRRRRGEGMWHSACGLNNTWWPNCSRWHHQLGDVEGVCLRNGRARDQELGVSGEHAALCPANRSILAVCKPKHVHLVDGTCVANANAGLQCTKHPVVRGLASPMWWIPGYINSDSHIGPWVTSWSPDGSALLLGMRVGSFDILSPLWSIPDEAYLGGCTLSVVSFRKSVWSHRAAVLMRSLLWGLGKTQGGCIWLMHCLQLFPGWLWRHRPGQQQYLQVTEAWGDAGADAAL